MHMSDKGLEITKSEEGLELHAYPDPATGAEPWTIGYGHTKGVKPGDVCTEEQAVEFLKEDLLTAERDVKRLVMVPLTQGQFDALVDFVFNVGGGNFSSSTMLKKLNAKDYKGARDEFPKWNRGAGKVLPGLVRRRAKCVKRFDELD